VAVIVSTDDLKRLEALEDVADVHDAKAALKEAAKHGTIPLDAVLLKHGLDHLIQPHRATTPRRGRTVPAKRRNLVASRARTGRRRG
jgi:hypothetical protein